MEYKIEELFLSVVVPALNEEKNIALVIENIISAFKKFCIVGEILVIDNGSKDNTSFFVEEKIKKYPDIVKLFSFFKPIGLGGSFWEGVNQAKGNIFLMIPGDNENKPDEILKYLGLLENVDMIIPYVENKNVRSRFRNILSFIYRFIINKTFNLSLNYTNGTVLYKKYLLESLAYRNKSFFYQVDILVRLIKKGFLFAQVPYKLGVRNAGKSKAVSLRALWDIMKGYISLIIRVYFRRKI